MPDANNPIGQRFDPAQASVMDTLAKRLARRIYASIESGAQGELGVAAMGATQPTQNMSGVVDDFAERLAMRRRLADEMYREGRLSPDLRRGPTSNTAGTGMSRVSDDGNGGMFGALLRQLRGDK